MLGSSESLFLGSLLTVGSQGHPQAYAQRAFEKKWPEKNFCSIFGRNYILEAEIEKEMEENVENTGSAEGFKFVADGLEGMDW